MSEHLRDQFPWVLYLRNVLVWSLTPATLMCVKVPWASSLALSKLSLIDLIVETDANAHTLWAQWLVVMDQKTSLFL